MSATARLAAPASPGRTPASLKWRRDAHTTTRLLPSMGGKAPPPSASRSSLQFQGCVGQRSEWTISGGCPPWYPHALASPGVRRSTSKAVTKASPRTCPPLATPAPCADGAPPAAALST
uniref:Uncharacterized protein n=1 Tax=Emiliania huxleyi TaxID=2903 RepID=A0A7S3X032_EMIHU